MGLVDYILEQIPLFEYYDKFISELNPRFKQYSYNSGKLVLCYFKDHDDVNPSMGWLRDKKNRDVKVCHCFGCGRTANVVRIHQILSSQYFNREMTEIEACKDLAEIFRVSIEEFKDTEDDLNGEYIAQLNRGRKLQKSYTVQDFKYSLKDIRLHETNNTLEKLNSECVKMIATKKQLYY